MPTLTTVRLGSRRAHHRTLTHFDRLDASVTGSKWDAAGSPSLAHLIKGAALDVPHPTDPSRTLWDARQDHGPFVSQTDALQNKAPVLDDDEVSIDPLGSGSDFTPFIQHLGVGVP